jgi:hypothetical protein
MNNKPSSIIKIVKLIGMNNQVINIPNNAQNHNLDGSRGGGKIPGFAMYP